MGFGRKAAAAMSAHAHQNPQLKIAVSPRQDVDLHYQITSRL